MRNSAAAANRKITCNFATMACIIAPTAGKPATFTWPKMKTNSDPALRIQCTLHCDLRLVSGATAIVTHVARQAGLSEDDQNDLTSAALTACRQTPGSSSTDDSPRQIQIDASAFSDRVEVGVEFSGNAVSASLEGLAADRVSQENVDGRTRLTLVKYSNAAKARAKA